MGFLHWRNVPAYLLKQLPEFEVITEVHFRKVVGVLLSLSILESSTEPADFSTPCSSPKGLHTTYYSLHPLLYRFLSDRIPYGAVEQATIMNINRVIYKMSTAGIHISGSTMKSIGVKSFGSDSNHEGLTLGQVEGLKPLDLVYARALMHLAYISHCFCRRHLKTKDKGRGMPSSTLSTRAKVRDHSQSFSNFFPNRARVSTARIRRPWTQGRGQASWQASWLRSLRTCRNGTSFRSLLYRQHECTPSSTMVSTFFNY